MNDFEKVLGQTVLAQNNLYRAALSTHPAQRKLDAILRCYDECKDDERTRIPTRLMLLIEAARA